MYTQKSFNFNGTEVYVKLSTYPDGNARLDLQDAKDGFPYATCSLSMPNVLLCDDEILVKNYSENQGMTDFLVKNNIVTLTHTGMDINGSWAPVARINPSDEWGNKPRFNPEPLDYDEQTGKYTWEMDGMKISAKTFTEAVLMLPFLKQTLKDHY
jgi:hypothetical protein